MSDYISREAALTVLDWDCASQDALNVIKAIPAADVAEVVRCRECIYWRGANDLCKGICIDFDADGYCSEGKRKDGGQDE